MDEYNVHLTVEAKEAVEDEDLGCKVLDYFEDKEPDFMGVVAGQTLRGDGALSITYNLETKGAVLAVERGLKALAKILGRDKPKILDAEVNLWEDPDFAEPVSRSEIARRLGISAARVYELAKRRDFPPPTRFLESRPLYKWGEVKAWNEQRLREAKPGPPRKGDKEAVAA